MSNTSIDAVPDDVNGIVVRHERITVEEATIQARWPVPAGPTYYIADFIFSDNHPEPYKVRGLFSFPAEPDARRRWTNDHGEVFQVWHWRVTWGDDASLSMLELLDGVLVSLEHLSPTIQPRKAIANLKTQASHAKKAYDLVLRIRRRAGSGPPQGSANEVSLERLHKNVREIHCLREDGRTWKDIGEYYDREWRTVKKWYLDHPEDHICVEDDD